MIFETGAHHYIAGSIEDPRFKDKTYYTDHEVHSVWPEGCDRHIVSTVPAGSIIIEDTRGLHKAGVPKRAFRDLGFAVFLPPNISNRGAKYYSIAQKHLKPWMKSNVSSFPNRTLIDKTMNDVVVVTGGTKGIGRAITEAFVSQGYHVIVGARASNSIEDLNPQKITFKSIDVRHLSHTKSLHCWLVGR